MLSESKSSGEESAKENDDDDDEDDKDVPIAEMEVDIPLIKASYAVPPAYPPIQANLPSQPRCYVICQAGFNFLLSWGEC